MIDTPKTDKTISDRILHQIFLFPNQISYYALREKHIYIAPRQKSWIVLNNIGNEIFNELMNKSPLFQAIPKIIKKHNIGSDKVHQEVVEVVNELNRKQFHEKLIPAAHSEDTNKPNLLLGLTNRCPLRCIHCLTDSGTAGTHELNQSDFEKIIQDYSKAGHSISFYGGEPLSCDFLQL